MNDTNMTDCRCNTCPGASCNCGCRNASPREACACGPQCRCEGACTPAQAS